MRQSVTCPIIRFNVGDHRPPPLIFHANGDCTELKTEGGLLGVFPDEHYAQIEVELAVDDRMLLYSDGFEQAFPAHNTTGYDARIPTDRYRTVFESP